MMFRDAYEEYRTRFEACLGAACAKMDFAPAILSESMKYSLLAGGKRLRPVLFFAALDGLGAEYLREGDLAVAIECIHTYSLIHDDLPAMDNDDFRRGMPSNHKKFGEGNAILAGDALLSHAFELMLAACGRGEAQRRAAVLLARAAGPRGMIAGQSADLFYGASENAGEAELHTIYAGKTGAMIAAPLAMAGEIAGRDSEMLASFGEDLGFLFQLTDDLIDSGEENRLTALKVYGKARAEALADAYAQRCRAHLESADFDAEFLLGAVDFIRKRTW